MGPLCQHSRSGTFFHLAGWKSVIESSLGHRYYGLVARRHGAITGVFPMSLVRSRLFGASLVSLPLAVYGGVCAEDRESYFALLDAGRDLADRLGVRYVEMRNRAEPFATSLPGRDLYVTFTQDLSAGARKAAARPPSRYPLCRSKVVQGGTGLDREFEHRRVLRYLCAQRPPLGNSRVLKTIVCAFAKRVPERLPHFWSPQGRQGHCRRDVLLFQGPGHAILWRRSAGILQGLPE